MAVETLGNRIKGWKMYIFPWSQPFTTHPLLMARPLKKKNAVSLTSFLLRCSCLSGTCSWRTLSRCLRTRCRRVGVVARPPAWLWAWSGSVTCPASSLTGTKSPRSRSGNFSTDYVDFNLFFFLDPTPPPINFLLIVKCMFLVVVIVR